MKLQNKETGEIRDFIINKDKIQTSNAVDCWEYSSLAKLNEEWKDYEKPKVAYFIDAQGDVCLFTDSVYDDWTKEEQIGNKFKTEEEAEKAVEKLKAWQRLKDKGFRFTGFSGGSTFIEFTFDKPGEPGSAYKDLDLLFGGKDA